MDNDINILVGLCQSYFGCDSSWTASKIKGEGSNRKYYRLVRNDADGSCIGVIGENARENRAFVHLDSAFVSAGLPVPQVYAVSDDSMAYIQQDLGSIALFDLVQQANSSGYSDDLKNLLCKTVSLLADFQFAAVKNIDFGFCFPVAQMDRRCVFWDLNYFKYNFIKLLRIDFSEPELEDDFEKLADGVLCQSFSNFMYRDFQSRNIMVCGGSPYMIDFQGGRRGPFLYDLASFVWQAKANFPDEIKNLLVDSYFNAVQKYVKITRDDFNLQLNVILLFRTLQVLGAYGYRGLFERKQHFVDSIPFALKNVRSLLSSGAFDNYPYLGSLLTRVCNMGEFKSGLTVKVFSFSYKKGIPADDSGNGGGYVFDCRGVHNPGKYDQYKPLTGLDQPVIDFLEDDGEILEFLSHIYALADAHVARYVERGFSSLMFSCGCTGGQHRSVYSAQHLAQHIADKFGVKVIVCHREQGISSKYNF